MNQVDSFERTKFVSFVDVVVMFEGLHILRILFYANLLAGERDTSEIIETERDNDSKMEVELVSRRQRHNDDGDDDDNLGEQESNEQAAQSRSDARAEVTQATSTSPGRHRSTSFTMRSSTSEQDEIESIYEHPLQIRLHLEPNEYRHGHLSFDSFINEFANEKIEISKEYLEFIRQRSGTPHFSFILYPFFLSTTNKIGKSFCLSPFIPSFDCLFSLVKYRKQSSNVSTTTFILRSQHLQWHSFGSILQNLCSTKSSD